MTKLKTPLVKSSKLKTPLVKGDRVYYCDVLGEGGKMFRYKTDKGTVKSISACIDPSDSMYAVVEWDTGEVDDVDPVTGDFGYGTVRRTRWRKAQN